jgi:hypothetical protein
MRFLAELTAIVVLVACVAALTLVSVIQVFDAAIDVGFTTFGTDDSGLLAGDWDLCVDVPAGGCN